MPSSVRVESEIGELGVPYAKRDAAFRTWFAVQVDVVDTRDRARMRSAFNAGWEGRKRAEIEMMLEGMRR